MMSKTCYLNLQGAFDHTPRLEIKILLGVFNAEVSRWQEQNHAAQ